MFHKSCDRSQGDIKTKKITGSLKNSVSFGCWCNNKHEHPSFLMKKDKEIESHKKCIGELSQWGAGN